MSAMKDVPPSPAREPGIQPDPTLQPAHKASPIMTTIVAIAAVAVVTLVFYGLNAPPQGARVARNSPPAQAQDPAAATANTAAQNATDASKPQQGQAKQDNSAAAQADQPNKPQGAQTGQPQTTTGQAPSTEKQGASPVRPNG